MNIINSYRFAGADFLLDTYDMTAGWSLRKLKSGITYGIEVRRSSDNALVDVQLYNSGSIDLSSTVSVGGTLGAWASTDTVYIRTYYNQGNGGSIFDMEQSTDASQPILINAGTLNTYLGLTTAEHTSDWFQIPVGSQNLEGASGEISGFWCGKSDVTTVQELIDADTSIAISRIHQLVRIDNATATRAISFNSVAGNNQSTTSVASTTIPSILSTIVDTSNIQTFMNATSGTLTALTGTRPTGKTSLLALNARANLGTNRFTGKFFEALYDKGDQGSNRTAIVTDINDYYSMF